MKCLVCGKNYIAVGVHAKHKHGLTANEYRREFGLKLSQPLVDTDLSEHLSRMQRNLLRVDPERKSRCVERCLENAAKCIGTSTPRPDLPTISRSCIAGSNTRRKLAYYEEKKDEVARAYLIHGSVHHARASIGMSGTTMKAIMTLSGVTHNKDMSKALGAGKAAVKYLIRREQEISRFKEAVARGMGKVEALKHAGVSVGPYKVWRRLGLVEKFTVMEGPTQ